MRKTDHELRWFETPGGTAVALACATLASCQDVHVGNNEGGSALVAGSKRAAELMRRSPAIGRDTPEAQWWLALASLTGQ